jgi:ABC-2 type transport system ATP-binding protein
MPIVECSELVVRYGDVVAVDGVTFHAEGGEIVAVLGPNGAGKTSTLEVLEGYRAASSGSVRILGCDPRRDHRRLAPRIGVMLQRAGVYPMLSPRRVVGLFARYYADPEPVGSVIETVGLTEVAETPFRHLSGGEQQRLSLALALVGRPEVVFLDEPTAGVDPGGRSTLRSLIRTLHEQGRCVVLTTHELHEAELLADRIIIVNQGCVVTQGTVAELAEAAGPVSLRFSSIPGLPIGELSELLSAVVMAQADGWYEVQTAPTPERIATLATWLAGRSAELIDLRSRRSLEESYLALVKEHDGQADPSPPRRPRRHP